MKDHTEEIELIEKYLDDALSPDEKVQFESRIQTEPGLAEEIALHRQIRVGLHSVGRSQMLGMLAETDRRMAEYHPPAQVIRFDDATRQRFYWVAAAIVLLLIPLYLVLNQSYKSNRLFATYFTPYRGVSVPAGDPLAQAMQEYQQRDYAQALPILERLLGEGASEDTTLFYKGNVSLALHNTPEAITSFRQIVANPRHPYYQEAQWYLALAYLQDKDKDEAKAQLQTVTVDTSHPHYEEASKLLHALK